MSHTKIGESRGNFLDCVMIIFCGVKSLHEQSTHQGGHSSQWFHLLPVTFLQL